MTEHLRYEATPGGLRAVAPKAMIDSIIGRRGAMLHEIRLPRKSQLVERSYANGLTWLDFDFTKIRGEGRSRESTMEGRAWRVMDAIAQIDEVSQREGFGDPRMQIMDKLGETAVVFDRPDGSPEQIAGIAREAIDSYARLMGIYGDGLGAQVTYDLESPVSFSVPSGEKSSYLGSVLSEYGTGRAPAHRIELRQARPMHGARAQLATLMGVVAILPEPRIATIERQHLDAEATEFRHLAAGIKRTVYDLGNPDDEGYQYELRWSSADGGRQILLHVAMGAPLPDGQHAPAALSAMIRELDQRSLGLVTRSTELTFSFHKEDTLGIIDPQDDLDVALRVTSFQGDSKGRTHSLRLDTRVSLLYRQLVETLSADIRYGRAVSSLYFHTTYGDLRKGYAARQGRSSVVDSDLERLLEALARAPLA